MTRLLRIIAKTSLLSLFLAGLMLPSNSEATVLFAKRSQRMLYQASSTQYDIEVTKEGIKFQYSFSGANPIAIQNYCGFWLSVCEDENWVDIKPYVPSISPGL